MRKLPASRKRHACPSSVLSLWSQNSVLSIGSSGSVLSVGSVGSALSVGSVGSVLSVGSIGSALSLISTGSWLSTGSLLSAQSRWSVLSWGASRGFRSARAVAGAGLLLAWALQRGRPGTVSRGGDAGQKPSEGHNVSAGCS